MLETYPAHAVGPTHDLDTARRFWTETVGAKVSLEFPSAKSLLLACGEGSEILLYPTQIDVPAQHTTVLFMVPDLASTIADLESRGVTFEEYDLEPVTVRAHDTGQGAVVRSYHATRQVELWRIDDPDNPIGPCEDTAGQAGPWAAGDVTVALNDNDVDVSGTRRNSFGDRGQGTVFDTVGDAWHYSWTFRAHCIVDCEDDFTLRVENITLKKKGK